MRSMEIKLQKIKEHSNGEATFIFDLDNEMENFIKKELGKENPTDKEYSNYIYKLIEGACENDNSRR